MDVNRRAFIKAGSGAIVASVLGFDVRPAYAQSKDLNCAHHRDPVHLPRIVR
jgi:hypothetical protein